MTDKTLAFENLPNWPRWLNRWQAAAYLGVSTGTFKKEQRAGLWPAAGRSSGKWQLWDRRLLDFFSDRLSDISSGETFEDVGYVRDPDYIRRRIAEYYGRGPDSPPKRKGRSRTP